MNFKLIHKLLIVVILASFIWVSFLFGHCEIPCGIYDDKMRIDMIKEHITTIEKSMNEINTLSKQGEKNYNQLVRWIGNKEEHANQLQHIVTQYFMTQRLKPVDHNDQSAMKEYHAKLTLLHHMLVYSMKAKQTTDQQNIDKLRELVGQFYEAYFGEKEKEHLKDH
jgi:nickel superoxide dismutase